MDVVLATVVQHGLLAVRREVVEDQMDPLLERILPTQQLQDPQKLLVSLAFADITEESLAMNIVEGQPVANAVKTSVRRRQSLRPIAA